MKLFLSIVFVFASAAFVNAGIGTWDFENGSTQPYLSLQCGSGVLTRGTSGAYFLSSESGRPPEYGTFSVTPANFTGSSVPYIVNFGNELPTSFSVDMYDGQPDLDTLRLQAFSGPNGTGTLIAEATDTIVFPVRSKRLTVRGNGIRSVVFIGTDPNGSNSVLYDNFQATCPPNGTIYRSAPDASAFSDFTTFRPSDGTWYTQFWDPRPPFSRTTNFGLASDKPIPGDFDGNRVSDIAVYRDGVWYVLLSVSNVVRVEQFGVANDIPLSTDFDVDGRTDLAVFRPTTGTWYWRRSSDGQFASVQWGGLGDIPLPGYYDLDGVADLVVYRPSDGNWYILRSSDQSFEAVRFGVASDKPVPADYDGDGITDIAVFRSGVWYLRKSSTAGQTTVINWGVASDIPVPGDYHNCTAASIADGQADVAVWRPSAGVWYHMPVDGGSCARVWGSNGDIPISLVPPVL